MLESMQPYLQPINHGKHSGFPSKSNWCEVINWLSAEDQFAWFHEITHDLDNGRVVVSGLGNCLMLSGYSYLGLNRREEIRTAILSAYDRYSGGSAGSRWLAGHTSLHRELEELLAEVHGTEDAITFASGYVASHSTITALVGRKDAVFGDRINHASLVDGCRQSGADFRRFPHNDVDKLRSELEHSKAKRKFVVVDGVGSMNGLICKAPEIIDACKDHEALLMIDECHSHFVLGSNGGGIRDYFNLHNNKTVDIEMGTLGKALHSTGGYIASTRDICNYLRRQARGFIYSRSISPIDIASGITALKIFIDERQQLVTALQNNRQSFVRALNENGLATDEGFSPIVPIPVGPAVAAARAAVACQKRGVFIHPIFPPVVPKGKSILRASMMANHKEDDLQRAAEIIAEEVKLAINICSPEEAAMM